MSRSKYVVGDYSLRVGRSRTGLGVFACEDIPKHVCVEEYTGKLVREDKLKDTRGKYLFAIGKNLMIDGNVRTNRARYINHSCAPNCEATGPRGKVFILTLRRIKAGEELTYNYGKEYFDLILKQIGCKCLKCTKKKAAKRRAKAAVAKERPNGRATGRAKTAKTSKAKTAKRSTAKRSTAKRSTAKRSTAKTSKAKAAKGSAPRKRS
jgi:uncharacterized protein